ncbi:DinB family protein [Taibaiella soli]|uniref:Damage-inducible protein DinB n=1 Tax=Taibaiella soli TaxID=1649169 RepID=A0A2W2AV28_9BACT|nr:DinB family protein [Taibaiella soli]PZF71538.1 hypothetical protein DN068_15795 [Taibaiella soli]
MYRLIEDFVTDWKHEAESTLKIFSELTDASLTEHVAGYKRTIGRLAWHITQTTTEMMHRVGLFDNDALEQVPQPATVSEIAADFKKYADALVENIQQKWTDATLLEKRHMYGEEWVNGITLSILIKHMAHHRAQITVLMRQLGLVVPGVYGPANEEWLAFGMQPME